VDFHFSIDPEGFTMLHLEDGAMPGHLPSFAGETLEDALEFLGVGLAGKICKIKGKRSISTAKLLDK